VIADPPLAGAVQVNATFPLLGIPVTLSGADGADSDVVLTAGEVADQKALQPTAF